MNFPQLQDNFDQLKLAEQKKQQPRKRKHFDPLPHDVQEQLIAQVKSSALWQEVERLEGLIKQEKRIRERILNEVAPHVTMVPDNAMHRLKTSTSLSYGSQGYGAMRYAKGDLEPYLDMLVVRGFDTFIRQTNYQRVTGTFAVDHCDYELWSNCPPWMFDAVRHGSW